MQNKLRTIIALSGELHETIDEYGSAPDFSIKIGDIVVSVEYDFNDVLSHVKVERDDIWVIVDHNVTSNVSLSHLSLSDDLNIKLDAFIDDLMYLSCEIDLSRRLTERSVMMNHHKSEFNKLATIQL